MSNRFPSGLILENQSAEPALPPAGELDIYSRRIAGRSLPKWQGDDGDFPFQQALWGNMLHAWFPGNSTTLTTLGGAVTNVGTVSHPALADTNLKTRTSRFLNTSATAAGSLASTRPTRTEFSRNTGFFSVWRGGLSTLQTGMRFFAGVTDGATTAPTNVDPLTSTAGSKIGVACNDSSGTLKLIHNLGGAAPTVVDLGYAISTTNLFELILFAAPGSAQVGYRFRNLSIVEEGVSGTLSTNLPALATFMGRQIWACNNTVAAAVAWDCSRFVVETDF